jgi:hypothetical protein
MALVSAVAPQPPWTDAATFMRHYHHLQALPFLFGFVLLLAFPALQVALHLRARPAARPFTLLGVVFAAVFAALIAFNYIAQTALVPAAVARGDGALVALFSMNSPTAICWAIEMFGYGFLGVASLCALPALPGPGLERCEPDLAGAQRRHQRAGRRPDRPRCPLGADARWPGGLPGLERGHPGDGAGAGPHAARARARS